MLRGHLIAATVAALSVLAQSSATLHAQALPSQAVQRLSTLADIKTSVVHAIGAQEQAVEIAWNDKILTVWRINSNMNEATHAGRDNEATAIVSIVSKGIAGKPEFKTVIAILIQYVIRRSALGTDSKLIDSVEFRKGPNGVFQFHQT